MKIASAALRRMKKVCVYHSRTYTYTYVYYARTIVRITIVNTNTYTRVYCVRLLRRRAIHTRVRARV